MLANLLSSKPKSRLVNLFLAHPDRSFSATELRVTSGAPPKLLTAALKELSKMGFLIIHSRDKNKYYQIDKHFTLYPELVSMLRKIKKTPVDLLAKEAGRIGECRYIALTGIFAGHPRSETDVLLVGKVSPKKLEKFLKLAEKFAERQVSYTVFTPHEFEYRKIMNDRFVKDIVENHPVVIVDRIRHKNLIKLVSKR